MTKNSAIRMMRKQQEYLRKETNLKNASLNTLEETCYGALSMGINALYKERPNGEWIWSAPSGHHKCSNCGCEWDFDDETPKFEFCPRCGSDMRGDSDDE